MLALSMESLSRHFTIVASRPASQCKGSTSISYERLFAGSVGSGGQASTRRAMMDDITFNIFCPHGRDTTSSENREKVENDTTY